MIRPVRGPLTIATRSDLVVGIVTILGSLAFGIWIGASWL